MVNYIIFYKKFVEHHVSALAKHAWENDHPIKWDDSELLVPVRNYFSRQICESVEIFKNKTILQEGKPLHDTWTCLFSN